MLTFGSLFSGIGGLDLGLERAGMRCAWQVEIDDYATRVLQKHWPDVPRFRDVRECGAHNLGAVDLICGGFPCQDISNAGKRAGIGGERSGLWSEFNRIICELRPRYVLVENVAALLVRGMGRVLGDLAAGGYDAEWQCLPAAAFGAPHIRDRVFILAHSHSSERWPQSEGRNISHGANTGRQETTGRPSACGANGRAQNVADAERIGCNEVVKPILGRTQIEGTTDSTQYGGISTGRAWWETEPDVGRVAHGVPHRVDRLRRLGLAVVPQVAEYIGRSIIQHAS